MPRQVSRKRKIEPFFSSVVSSNKSRIMDEQSFSTINVAPHPATYIPAPLPRKKAYMAPGQRDPSTTEIKLDARNFPSLGAKAPVLNSAASKMNFLTRVKDAENKREDDSIYDAEKIASMTVAQLIREGWLLVNKDGTFLDDQKNPILPVTNPLPSPITMSKGAFAFPPDSRRRLMSKKMSYTDLYDIDFEEGETGAMALSIDDDDGESSV